jgi:hypothetical protein
MANKPTNKPTHVAVFCIDGEVHISSFNNKNVNSMYKAHPYTEENVTANLDESEINAESVFEQFVSDVEFTTEGRVYTISQFTEFTRKNKQVRFT